MSKEDPKSKRTLVSSREFGEVKQALLFQLTNGGRPLIEVVDANFDNRGELCLVHRHVGVDLRWDWAQEVLANLVRCGAARCGWRRCAAAKLVRLGHDGQNVTEENLIAPPKAS